MGATHSNDEGFPGQTEAQRQQYAVVREKSKKTFQKVACGQVIIGFVLLCLGISGNSWSDNDGSSYYVGALIAGPLLLMGSVFTIYITKQIPDYDGSDTARASMNCAFKGEQILTFFACSGLVMGILFVAMSGKLSSCNDKLCKKETNYEMNSRLAKAIFAFAFFGFVTVLFTCHTLCSTSVAFGVDFKSNRQRTRMVYQREERNRQLVEAARANQIAANSQNTVAIAEIQEQNRLLQQQLQLQQQQIQILLQQQQHHHHQQQQQQDDEYYRETDAPYGDSSMNLPPPSYESVTHQSPPVPSAPQY